MLSWTFSLWVKVIAYVFFILFSTLMDPITHPPVYGLCGFPCHGISRRGDPRRSWMRLMLKLISCCWLSVDTFMLIMMRREWIARDSQTSRSYHHGYSRWGATGDSGTSFTSVNILLKSGLVGLSSRVSCSFRSAFLETVLRGCEPSFRSRERLVCRVVNRLWLSVGDATDKRAMIHANTRI